MNPMDILWLVLLIAFAVLEAATPQLVCIWFAAGSLAALITSMLHGPIWLQILLFAVISLVLVLCTRPLYRKYIAPRQVRTNADSLIGTEVPVTEEINNLEEQGAVKAKGLSWSARSLQEHRIIPKGTSVRVEKIDGVKLIVSPMDEPGETAR